MLPSDNISSATPLDNDAVSFTIPSTLKVKSSEWRYENEIRIYKDGSGLRAVNPKAIKEIRFGVKTSEESIEKIKEICAKKGFGHISFYRAKKAHGQFAVEFEIA